MVGRKLENGEKLVDILFVFIFFIIWFFVHIFKGNFFQRFMIWRETSAHNYICTETYKFLKLIAFDNKLERQLLIPDLSWKSIQIIVMFCKGSHSVLRILCHFSLIVLFKYNLKLFENYIHNFLNFISFNFICNYFI